MYYIDKVATETLIAQQKKNKINQINLFNELINGKDYAEIKNDIDILRTGNKIFFDKERQFTKYDEITLAEKGINRLMGLKKRYPFINLESYCDIGCGYGENPRAAVFLGSKHAVGIDIAPKWENFGENSDSRLLFVQSDISKKAINEKFTLVTSYASFEHFDSPELMLERMIDMVEEKGCLFINFSPIWGSTDGHHMYRKIQFPYYHLIFDEKIISDYYKENNWHNPNQFNYWSAFDFMNLFMRCRGMEIIQFSPKYELKDAYFVNEYPQLFSGYNFENLMISGFSILYRKL